MNAIHLAQTVYHWLKYQSICGRSELFCEAFLAQPIGEYCLSLNPRLFEAESPLPPAYQGNTRRKRSLDFALFGNPVVGAQKVMTDAIETKFITSRRDFAQEVYDDLFRLLWFQPTREPEHCRRWLVIAGFSRNIHSGHFLEQLVQIGQGAGKLKRLAFRGLLSTDLNNHTRTKPMHAANAELRNLWVQAAENFGQAQLPEFITVRLRGRAPNTPHPADPCCYVWEIIRPQPDLGNLHPF